jgi:cellulose synthase operon protein B
VVAPARMLDPGMMASAGLDPEAVRAAWQERAEAAVEKPSDSAFSRAEIAVRNRLLLQRDVPTLCRLPRRGGRTGAAAPAGLAPAGAATSARGVLVAGPEPQDLFDAWNDTVRGRGRWLAEAGGWFTGPGRWVGDMAAASWSWASERLSVTAAPTAITPQASLVVAQSIQGDSPDNVVTIVTAPNAEILGASVACLADPRVWTRADGRLSILDASDGALDAVPAEATRYIPTGPLSIQNVRLITAGWLSMNPGLYVFVALLMALALSATTTHLVRNVGRRQE